ncbi:MAG TPA: CAP domain-containing protein, partial [Polyangia bacterium]|nr:CAP domain-containing protein [Polyangia bacterium]
MAFALAGCTAAAPQQPGVLEAALGEPNGDYPNYDERVVLYATNRARTDPAAAGWSSYPAQPPLQWDYDLNRSSRAHSEDMRDTPCFQHNSCNGTDVFMRIESYYTGAWNNIGENISAGVPDGTTAVYNWLYEIGAAKGETGHRDNIFSKDFTLLGAGFAAGGSQYQNYWTQDFIGTPVTLPHLTDGIHFPKTGAQVTFGATYYDAGGQAASRVEVILDGACNPLAKTRGTAANATYEAMIAVPSGCHAYYFRSTTGGVDSTYPDTGSLQVGSSCTTLFAAGHATPICDGGGGGGGG